MKLSILIPVYNESATLEELLSRVLALEVEKELILVDDNSTDGTREILKRYEGQPDIRVVYHDRNYGKGRAVRTALDHATGEIVVVQDADLEYDPGDLVQMIPPIERGEADVVFGSRRLKKDNPRSLLSFFIGGMTLNWITCRMYGIRITDCATCYKMMKTELLRSLNLKCDRFEFCPEVIAKLSRRKIEIIELPISYAPRTIEEGKKIRWRDGIEALWTLIKFRFSK
ncbi:MAG: glycosyltransferase family 2 protein [Pirellulales bacterium]|nr:glycosyltransferase family 2 protein [Pirellulales bacterium]